MNYNSDVSIMQIKTILILLLLIPSFLFAKQKQNLIFCYDLNSFTISEKHAVKYYRISDILENISLIKDLYRIDNISEFIYPETEDFDDVYPNFEIEIIKFDKNHISFKEKYTSFSDNQTAVDLIELDRISGYMSLYSFIYIDESGELYSEEGTDLKDSKKYYLKDNIYDFYNNASLTIYQCEKSKDL